MERQIVVADYQEFPAEDVRRLQGYVRESFDDLVANLVDAGQAYAGLAVAASGAFEVTVGAGVYLAAGVIYPQRAPVAKSLADFQPLTNKVRVAVVAWGTSGESETSLRDFVINLSTDATEARSVAIETARTCSLGFMKGVESADPQLPTIPLDRLLVASITLTPTGIEAIEMSSAGLLASLRALAGRTRAIEAWKAAAEPRISTIGSDVAALAAATGRSVDNGAYYRLAADVARLKEMAGLPDDFADYGADRFLDTDETDTTDLEYLAKVEEGIRFSNEAADSAALQVFNAINSRISQAGGILLPAYEAKLRLAIDTYSGEQAISQYSQTNHTLVSKTMARTRIRWGQSMNVCTNSGWWQSGQYDPASGIFRLNGEAWQVDEADRANALINHRMLRVTQFWTDTWEEAYWDQVTTTMVVAGAQIAQTFLNTQAGWLAAVDLFFTKRGPSGTVHLTICELTTSGTPDLTKALHQSSIAYLDIKTMDWTKVTITPTFLAAGRRYAIVLTTNGAHSVGMATGAGAYTAGTFFYSTDGAYFSGDLLKDMMFGLRFASFEAARVAVDLQPLSLSGGITDIDIIAGMVVPDATSLTFQVQINNVWVPLAAVSRNALIGLPPLLPLQAVFQGTSDIHAGIRLADSRVEVSRPRTAFKHVSAPRLLPAATQTVRVVVTLAAWNPARHTCAMSLKTAGGVHPASVVQDADLGGGRIERTFHFALAAAVSSFAIVTTGTSTTPLDLFLVEERVDIEF